MTVKELIEKLSELDQELHVFIPGYEGGYNYAEISEVKNICLNVTPNPEKNGNTIKVANTKLFVCVIIQTQMKYL
jgi:hypothetical protein